MVFFLEITNIWQKSGDFWFVDFFIQIFKILRLIWIFLWIFGCFEWVSSMFSINLLQTLHFTNTAFIKADLQKHFCIIWWCLVCQRNPEARPLDLKISSLERNPANVTWQLTKFRNLGQNYLCDFHLSYQQFYAMKDEGNHQTAKARPICDSTSNLKVKNVKSKKNPN